MQATRLAVGGQAETRETTLKATADDEPCRSKQEAEDDRCELHVAATNEEEGVGKEEDVVELMHREFSNRRKIVLSNLPPDFTEHVRQCQSQSQ